MRRTLLVTAALLLLALLYPSVASSTVYIGTGSLGGYLGLWNSSTHRIDYLVLQYSGPMRVDFDQRMVPDPDLPGSDLPQISLGAQTLQRATWWFDADGDTHPAFAGVSSGGFVGRLPEPPGFGPMTAWVDGLTSWGGFTYVGPMTRGEHSLDLPGNFYAAEYSLSFGFFGTEVPEPASLLLLLGGGAAAGFNLRGRTARRGSSVLRGDRVGRA
jgi:hypothetical protein